MLTIDSATPADAAFLAANITPADAAELAAAGLTLEQSLEMARPIALRLAGRLVALFGAEPHPGSPTSGVPWMLCTTVLAEVSPRAMAEISAEVVLRWRGQFTRLANLVHRENDRAVQFVQWLGFTVDFEPVGPGGQFFVFQWERPDV